MEFLIAETPSEPVWGIVAGLAVIVLIVLILPFRVKFIEHNLEVFFLVMGVLAVTVSGEWNLGLVIEALKAPVMIGSLPVGIVQVVLVFGLLVHFFYRQFSSATRRISEKLSLRVFSFLLVLIVGLFSSVLSVIVTSVLLAEIAGALPISRANRIRLVVVACFAAGLGAILTPLGEPMSTIMVQRLSGPPYNAGFVFPIKHFAVLVVPGVAAFAVFGAVWAGSSTKKPQAENPAASAEAPAYSETAWSVVLRAVKVYAFVAALVLLGEGFKPVITWFFMGISPLALYWINIVSAILDNATLTAIEINGSMSLPQIIAICMGLLISGGMLIPGNIPNIVSAGRLKITMKEWAVIGIPIGLVVLAIYFVILLFYIF